MILQRQPPVRLLVSGALIGLCTVVSATGCAKKAIRQAVPFDMDKIFVAKAEPQSTLTEGLKEKGLRLVQEKNYEQAVDVFKSLVVDEPESFFGFNAMAVCLKNMGDHASAMKNFDRSLEFADLNEERAKILANIGSLYLLANKPQVALGFYKEAAAEFKENPLYLILIARTFALLNEDERARKVLAEAEANQKNLDKFEKDEDRGLGHYLMAYSYLSLNNEDKVLQYLERALKANPTRFASRLKHDFGDKKSLLYTLRDDPRVTDALKRNSVSQWLETIFAKHTQPRHR